MGVTVGRTRRVTMVQAAQVLGISKEAIRKRVQRGTLRSDMGEDGRRYVYLDAGPDAGRENLFNNVKEVDPRDALVEELRDRVRALEEANRETRRLLAGALERIPSIESPEATESPSEAAEPRSGTDTPADVKEAQTAPRRRSWLRKWFGLE